MPQHALTPDNPLLVAGIGATTSIGLCAQSTVIAAIAGISNFSDHPLIIDKAGEPYVVASVPIDNSSLSHTDRLVQMAALAIAEALEPLQGIKAHQVDIVAVVALPEKRPGLPDDLDTAVKQHLLSCCPDYVNLTQTRTAYRGHALGLMAFTSAAKLLEDGNCEFCLVGGIDSYLNRETLTWLENNQQIHQPSNAWGFIPGEAASFCIVCTADTAKKYNIRPRALILSSSSATEKKQIKTQTYALGEGLTQAVRSVVSLMPDEFIIDQTICDQNGEPYRADENGFMLCRLARHFADASKCTTPADCWGDVGAASGSLYLCLAVISAEKGYSKGPHSLLWASSEGGDRAAVLVRTPIDLSRAL